MMINTIVVWLNSSVDNLPLLVREIISIVCLITLVCIILHGLITSLMGLFEKPLLKLHDKINKFLQHKMLQTHSKYWMFLRYYWWMLKSENRKAKKDLDIIVKSGVLKKDIL